MKKYLLFISNLFCAHYLLNAQGTWTQKANFGGGLRYGATSFSIGTKGYLGVGYCDSHGKNQDFWEWDQTTDTWTQKANFGGTARYFASGFSMGTKGYIGIGYDGFNSCQDFWEWDQAINLWTQKANFGGVARHHAIGFSIGARGYIGTGWVENGGGIQSQDFWEWNQSTDTWTQKANFGGTARKGAVGFSIGTKGYIGTGEDFFSPYTASHLTQDFWEWDQNTNAWTQKTNFGGIARYHAIGFSMGTKGYIGTGADSVGHLTQDFWEWDQSTDTWTQKINFSGSARLLATGFSIGTKGYIATGVDTAQVNLDFWEFNPVVATDIKENENNFSLNVFPNPSSGIFNIGINKPNADMKICIYDVLGNCVLSNITTKKSNQRIDLSNQPKGIYFVEMMCGNERRTRKIILE